MEADLVEDFTVTTNVFGVCVLKEEERRPGLG